MQNILCIYDHLNKVKINFTLELYCDLLPQNRFLDEQNVAARLLDLFHDVKNILAFLSQYTVHLCIVWYNDLQQENQQNFYW